MTAAAVAALCLAGALFLAKPVARGSPLPWPVLIAPFLGLVLVLAPDLVSARHLAPLPVLAVAVAGLVLLRRRVRRGTEVAETAARIQEVCEALGAELAAGRPVQRCLVDAVEVWPPLTAAATAHELGASVPEALRGLADQPGAGDLRLVAAAWQVSQRTGAGLADALAEVAQSLRARRATRRVVRSELASARSTARLVVALPVLTLLLGSGTGGDPVGFLLTTPVGLGCLAGGVTLALAGLWWIEAIAGSVAGDTA